MQKKRLSAFVFSLLLSVSSLVAFAPMVTNAASCTWTGGGSNDDFSTAANWSGCTGGGAPQSGDSVTINNAGPSSLTVTDDQTGVSLAGITLTGSAGISVYIEHPLTVTGDITAPGSSNSVSYNIAGDITLGADVAFTNVGLSTVTSPPTGNGKTLNLNGHTLDFSTNSNYTYGTIGIDQDITGNGQININVGDQSLFMEGSNTFTGVTNIIAAGDVTNLAHNVQTIYGSSTIVIGADATLSIHAPASLTFSNPIIVHQASSNNNVYGNQLIVWNDTSNSAAITATIPNITLQGNTRFGVNETFGGVTVNLAGIVSNGYCIQYGDELNLDVSNFQNGPAGCVVSGTSNTVKAPNTGFGKLASTPLLTVAVTSAAALGLMTIRKRQLAVKK